MPACPCASEHERNFRNPRGKGSGKFWLQIHCITHSALRSLPFRAASAALLCFSFVNLTIRYSLSLIECLPLRWASDSLIDFHKELFQGGSVLPDLVFSLSNLELCICIRTTPRKPSFMDGKCRSLRMEAVSIRSQNTTGVHLGFATVGSIVDYPPHGVDLMVCRVHLG